jgi:tetratricopeptide (TPR) repeat protein
VRYRLLESLRKYAADSLAARGEVEGIRRAHAEHYLRMLDNDEDIVQAFGQFDSGLPDRWVGRVACEHENLRAALDWLTQSDPPTGLRLAALMWRFWQLATHLTEGRHRLSLLLERVGTLGLNSVTKALRAGGLHTAGRLALFQSDYDASHALFQESLILAREIGDVHLQHWSLLGMAMASEFQGDYGHAVADLDEAVALSSTAGDPQMMAEALMRRGLVSQHQGDYDAARTLLEQSLALRRQPQRATGLGPSLGALGYLMLDQGDLRLARALFEERLAFWRAAGATRFIALSLNSLGAVALAEGDHTNARATFQQALAMGQESDWPGGLGFHLACFAMLALAEGEPERAARLAGAAFAAAEAFGTPFAPSLHFRFGRMLELAGRAKTDAGCEAAWAVGQAMSPERAAEYALALVVESTSPSSAATI